MESFAGEIEDLSRELRALLISRQNLGLWVETATSETVEVEPAERSPAVRAWAHAARDARVEPNSGRVALERVRDQWGDCQRCPLSIERKNLVFGVGDPSADLMIVGEGPGYKEDQQGEPFVGDSGQMLDKMLQNVIGLSRQQTYILNIVKCRPPKNRDPTPQEIEVCHPILLKQIRVIRPKIILVLGSVAFRSLLRTEQSITRSRGKWMVYRDREHGLEIPVMPTFHPAYLLRTPGEKRKTFEDLKAVSARYDKEGGRRI